MMKFVLALLLSGLSLAAGAANVTVDGSTKAVAVLNPVVIVPELTPIKYLAVTTVFSEANPLEQTEAMQVVIYNTRGEEVGRDNYTKTTPGAYKSCSCITFELVVPIDTNDLTVKVEAITGTFILTDAYVTIYDDVRPPWEAETITDPLFAEEEVTGPYPVPAMTYTPDYPQLDNYSINPEGVCDANPVLANTQTVTLGDGETLLNAWNRLYALTSAAGSESGIIEIPYDTQLVQCDSLNHNKSKSEKIPYVTIKGIPGPQGQQPRFYCRSDKFNSGTVPNAEIAGDWISYGPSSVGPSRFVVENIHKDGYKAAMTLGTGAPAPDATIVIRNSYFHHGFQDGIGSGNNVGDADFSVNKGGFDNGMASFYKPYKVDVAFCGSEMAFHGQGNTIHGFYLHRALGGGGDNADWVNELGAVPGTYQRSFFIDSECHTANNSSCLKSIANEVYVYNSKLWGWKDTDPSFLVDAGPGEWIKTGQMLVDISACSKSIIQGNEFWDYRPATDSDAGGDAQVAYRQRKRAIRGCDIPHSWTPYGTGIDGSTGSGPTPTAVTIADGGAYENIMSDAWWTALGGKIYFPHILDGNTFTTYGDPNKTNYAIKTTPVVQFYSTYATYETRLGGGNCWLPVSDNWYERARVYATNNTFVDKLSGEYWSNESEAGDIGQLTGSGACPYAAGGTEDPLWPGGPGPVTTQVWTDPDFPIEIGAGNTYIVTP